MFSSPNFGALFNLHSIIAYDVFETKQNYDSFLGKEHRTSPEISVLSKTLKKPRLLKRALFAMDLPEALSVSLKHMEVGQQMMGEQDGLGTL